MKMPCKFLGIAAITGSLIGGASRGGAEEDVIILPVQAVQSMQAAPSPAPDGMPSNLPPALPQPSAEFASTAQRPLGPFSSGLRRPSSRLYDAPNMFGDMFSPGGTLSFQANQQLLFLDPNSQTTINPAVIAALQQQLSQNATLQAQQQAAMSPVMFNPAIIDPAVIAALQQQLSQDATMQAQQQVIDQQGGSNGSGEFFVDPSLINVTVVIPDLNSAIIQPGSPTIDPSNVNVSVVLPDLTGALVEPVPQLVRINVQGQVDLQMGGGTRRTKISENNSSLPQDRFIFSYNHFHNALCTDEFSFPAIDPDGLTRHLAVRTRQTVQSVNRYTLGFEKTFEGGQSSIEVRMPLIGQLQNPSSFDVASEGGNVGNLSLILKRLFWTTDNFAFAGGLGLNLPTGSDATGFLTDVNWEVENEAVHVLPFLGIAGSPTENFFYQAFAQLDVPTDGNSVVIEDRFGRDTAGRLNDQTLLYLDATGGAWLYRTENPCVLRGLAAILELHYTTTLQDTDAVGAIAGANNNVLFFSNADNRRDILNGSVGLHTVLSNGTTLRVGGVFPLRQSDGNRLFDAEVQAQLNVPF